MHQGSPVATVEWQLTNDSSSQTEFTYAPWFHHFTGVAGESNTYFFPTEAGVKEFLLPARGEPDPKSEEWFFEPSRGWTAVVAGGGSGLALTMEYKYLNCFYHWAGKSSAISTHEWRFNKLLVPPGESIKTTYAATPFVGLTRVDGAIPGAVGQIEFADAVPTGTLFLAAGEETGDLTLETRTWPDGQWEAAKTATVAAAAQAELGSLTALAMDAPLPAGAHEVRLVLKRGDVSTVVAERPYASEGIRMAYHMDPPEERVGLADKAVKTQGHEHNMSVVTPHFPWARPHAGGTAKALVLMGDRHSRDAIELAQRTDIDFTYIKHYSDLSKEWKYHGDRSIQTLDQAQERLDATLDEPFDVMVISGLKWDHHFTPEIQDKIEAQVRAGTGLVYIEPEGFTEDDMAKWPMMGVSKDKPQRGWNAWESPADHSLTRALPWADMPRTRRMTYDPWPDGEVLATYDDGNPLMVASSLGEGRVLTLTYDTLTHDYSYRGYSALTPILGYRGGFLLDEYSDRHDPYWELWYAMLARSVTWAAKRETAVEVSDISLGLLIDGPATSVGRDATARCSVAGDFEPIDGSVRWRVVDPWGREHLDETEPVRIESGAELDASITKLLPGRSLIFVQLLDPSGGAVAWGATSHFGTPGGQLADLSASPDILLSEPDGDLPPGDANWRQWSPDADLELSVNLTALTGFSDLSAVASVTDTHGRMIARQVKPLQPTDESVAFTVPLAGLVNSGLLASVDLRSGDLLLDHAEMRVIAPRPRVWDRFSFTSWNGQYLWRSHYLFDTVADRVADLGLDYALNGSNEYGTGKVWDDHWHNIGHSDLGLLSYMGRGIARFDDEKFAENSKGFAETGDTKFLVREPCLNNPEWRDAVMASIQARVLERQDYGGCYDYCMGDEMSLTYYTRYHDYCWSDFCLPKFRDWLRDRYGDLDGLNAAWSTNHAAWDDVLPMPLKDAKTAANPGPWADHRSFMNTTLAEFSALIQETIDEVDPGARSGLSGTQSPEAGNGIDWWKLSGAFSYYHSYNTSWSNEMRRSFQSSKPVDQSPYYLGYWQSGRSVEYNGFWCLLHDTKGISAWTTPLFFYGDLTESECGASTREYITEMKDGIWELIRQSKRQHDGIAILYSQESVNAAALLDKGPALNASRDAWVKIIEDLGLQYEFIAAEQLAEGILADDFKVCVLPMSIALSPEETAALTTFANAGGTIVADAFCGLRDDICRPLDEPALDSLFGVARIEGAAVGADVGINTTAAVGDIPADSEIRLAVAETGISLTSGQASAQSADGVPALIRGDVGRGRAYLLNLDLTQFEEERRFHSPAEVHVRQIVADMLSAAGVDRPVVVTFESGKAPHVEVVRYTDGDLEYIGLLRVKGSGDPETALVKLPREAIVYDVRAGRSLGKLDAIRVPMEAGEARVYCLAADALPAPALSAPGTATAGEALPLTVSVPSAANAAARVLKLRLANPSGDIVGDYSRNIILRDGEASISIPLALNDPVGEWALSVTDCASGESAGQTLTVAAP